MLVPCTTCRRHLRAGASECPFCGAAFAAPLSVARFDDVRRLGRVIVASTAAGIATTMFACSVYGAPSEPWQGSCRPGTLCTGGLCEPSPLTGYGRCARTCATHADCTNIGRDYACLPSTVVAGKTVCFPPVPCRSQSECPTDLTCAPRDDELRCVPSAAETP